MNFDLQLGLQGRHFKLALGLKNEIQLAGRPDGNSFLGGSSQVKSRITPQIHRAGRHAGAIEIVQGPSSQFAERAGSGLQAFSCRKELRGLRVLSLPLWFRGNYALFGNWKQSYSKTVIM